jgi:hypothetical protein
MNVNTADTDRNVFSLNRRDFLAASVIVPVVSPRSITLASSDEAFLEDLGRRSFRYFWDQADLGTGLVLDRSRCDGTLVPGRNLRVASTALTGFYLTALCIGAERQWKSRNACRERVRQALRHLLHKQENVRGWLYHFVNQQKRRTGLELRNLYNRHGVRPGWHTHGTAILRARH